MDTFDIASEIEAINRTVGRRRIANGDGRSVVLRRSYDAPVEDVWDACSDPDRLKRWFGSVSGDLRLGGRFQIEGNAGGEILRCEPPRLLAVSWVYGDNPADEVELRLTPGRTERRWSSWSTPRRRGRSTAWPGSGSAGT